MAGGDDLDVIRFYFSFRSPYAWLAAERAQTELARLGVRVQRIPIYPKPELFPNDPTILSDKIRYMAQDVPRIARELGLTVRFPSQPDTDWALPHAAFLGADREGDGTRLMIEIFRKRFTEGLDVGDEQVLGDAAEKAGLDRDVVVGFARSQSLRAEVDDAWERAMREDHVFGVPTFVYAGKLYWGQDRMRYLASAVQRKRATVA